MELLDDTAQSNLMDRQRHYNMMSTIRCSYKYPCKVEFSSPSSCSWFKQILALSSVFDHNQE